MLHEHVHLSRCPACRYSFESSTHEAPDRCPQCGGPLAGDMASADSDGDFATEQSLTQKMRPVPKPTD